MKKTAFAFAITALACCTWSCNDNSTADNNADTTTNTGGDTTNTMDTNANTAPLTGDDSTFVMEAAIGGMMEVESGNLAQQNAMNQRVKDFGSMMVTDHSKANSELKSLVGGRLMIPETLPEDLRKHMDEMRKMTGKAFDNHYVKMMEDDHKKTIDKFQKQSQSGNDAQLKSWAAAQLPVLQKHRDSVEAIRKALK